MIQIDCSSCEKKGCCTYAGWNVYFLDEERDRVAARYGANEAGKIREFYGRRQGRPIYAVTLPCPFFEPSSGQCKIYEARPLACRLFPIEIDPITGETYLEQEVCPQKDSVKDVPALVQINVKDWCDKFWQVSAKEQATDKVPIANDSPQ